MHCLRHSHSDLDIEGKKDRNPNILCKFPKACDVTVRVKEGSTCKFSVSVTHLALGVPKLTFKV